MGPQLHSQRLAVDQGIHAQCKPLGKRRRFLAAPHLIRDGKPVALGAKRPKHADLDMVNHIDTLGIAGLEQTLAFALKVVTQRIPRQLAHRELLSNSSSRLAQTMHRKTRKQPIRWIQNPWAVHGHPGCKVAIAARGGQMQRHHPSLGTTDLRPTQIEQLRLFTHRYHRCIA